MPDPTAHNSAMRHIPFALCLIAVGASVSAQESPFAYPVADAPSITATKNVTYGSSGTVTLAMDVYRPSHPTSPRLPALVFFNRAYGPDRAFYFYTGWAQHAAAEGLIAIVPDLRDDTAADDFERLLTYLTDHSSELGIEANAIAVYAGSGNVYTALPVVENPKTTRVRTAVMLYGTGPVTEFRRDLPLLFVRAGLDRPGVNKAITELAALAVSQNAPVTLLNHSTGHHGFEIFDNTDATREVIDRIVAFVKTTTAPGYQAALRAGLAEATAAAFGITGRSHEAATAYAKLAADHPDDARLGLAYGEALLADSQFSAACAAFETLRHKDLGARDRGLPAARACLMKGDGDAAIGWLKTIPTQYLPTEIETDPAFAALKGRADFHALF